MNKTLSLTALVYLFVGILLLPAQPVPKGEATFNYNQDYSRLERTAVVNNHIYVSSINEQFFHSGLSESFLLKLDSQLNVVDSLPAGAVACEFCTFVNPIRKNDSTLWVTLQSDSTANPLIGNRITLLLEMNDKLQILDTLRFSFDNLRGNVIDIVPIHDTIMLTGSNRFPFYSVIEKTNFSVISDSLFNANFFLEAFLAPLFTNNHWYFMTRESFLRFWQINKDGRLDTIVNLVEPGTTAGFPFIPMRLLPGNNSKTAKLLAAGGGEFAFDQYELYDVNLSNHSFTLLDSFPLNLPPERVQGMTFPSSIRVESIWNNVDWVDLDNIYIGGSRSPTFNFRDIIPGDSTLKRYIHLYKIDSAGNTKWYRRLGDGSYYHFRDLTAHSHGVYITGIKYNWKNPPNGHVTEGFIMSINEKGEVIGQREIPISNQQLSVFPNPATKHINLQDLPEQRTPFQYRLFNLQGQLLQRGETRGRIDLQDLSSGAYWLRLSSKENSWQGTSKVVVE